MLALAGGLLFSCQKTASLTPGTYTRANSTDQADETYQSCGSSLIIGKISSEVYANSHTINVIEYPLGSKLYYSVQVFFQLPWQTDGSLLYLKETDTSVTNLYQFSTYLPISAYSSTTLLCSANLDVGSTSSFAAVVKDLKADHALSFSLKSTATGSPVVYISSFYTL
jgi:hypothetical protein